MYEITGYDVYDRGKTFYIELEVPQYVDTIKGINEFEISVKANYNKEHNAHAKIYAIYRITIEEYKRINPSNK